MKTCTKSLLVALIVAAAAPAVRADDRLYNDEAWRQYRASKRQQVGEVLGLWLPTWRPAAVGSTYLALADRLSTVDTTKCHPRLRMHIKKAECICTKLSEECVLACKSEIAVAITPYGPGVSYSSDRAQRIHDLLGELAASEDAVLKELMLNE